MTYGIRQGGEDETTVAFRDVATGADVGDKFPKGRYGGISLTKDLKAFYYAQFTPAGPRVYYHQMGTPKSADKMLFGEAYGPQNIISAGVTRDQKYLLITVFFGAGSEKNEIWYQDLTAKGPIQPLVKGEEARFSANYADNGVLFIETTWRAPRGRVVRVDLSKPGAPDTWKEIVPEGKFPLRSVALAGGHLITSTLENVVPKVRLLTPDGKLVREINPPKLGTVSGPGGNWESDEAFYSFTTYGQPGTIYRYSIRTGSQEVWFRSPAPVDPSQFEVRQVWYASKDGTKIPMFVAHKKGLRLDGTNPVYLTGYGGFNVSQVPGYGAPSTVFMEMGGIWAVPNLRGGSEFGEQWHRAGMLERKQNVFDDFIAAAEYLIANKYTNKEKLAIAGGSNGGLLVGAVMTQRPDLYKAVVCSVPLLDMVRYHRFLVARFWIPEYGSAENAEQFPFIYKYSPYHHVEKGVNYPAVMFVSGDSDTRVDPLHARKMAALMQASGTKNPVLLHYDTKSGHSGGLPVDKQIENTLDTLSFVTMQLGMQ
jgi:prolyl oligopeptidase